MAELFVTNRPAITKHLGNGYRSGEMDEAITCSILEHMADRIATDLLDTSLPRITILQRQRFIERRFINIEGYTLHS